MARDNRLFQEALKRGSAHAWNEEWDRAAQEYRLALREFPEDVSARTYLAMALYKSGELREALGLYSSLWNAQPSNLTMLQRVAELQEAVGEREGAAISYGRLADAHTRRRSPRDAFRAWQKVVALTPGNPLLWNSFVDVAAQAGMIKEVLPDYLKLARDLALQSRFQEAIQIVEKAVSLDPSDPLAVQLLPGIRRAMDYWFRASGLGETVLPEDLERLIPSLQTAETDPTPVSPEPSAPATVWEDSAPPIEEPLPELPEEPLPELPMVEAPEGPNFRELPIEEYEALTSPQVADEAAGTAEEAEAPSVELVADEPEPPGDGEIAVDPTVPEPEPAEVEAPEPEHEPAPDVAAPEVEVAEAEREVTAEGAEPVAAEAEVAAEPSPEGVDSDDLDGVAEGTDPEADWQQLMQEAEAARNSGEVELAIELFQQSLQTGTAVAQQFVELGNAQAQAGRWDEAAQAFAQALELAPGLPEALVGLARSDLSNHRLDAAERRAREAVAGANEVEPAAVELMLEIARERSAYGDLGGAAEALAWLRDLPVLDRLPGPLVERVRIAPSEVVGAWVADHLEEIAALPKGARGGAAAGLWKAEKLVGEGKLRSAADEMYQVLAAAPEFLPAQSVLGVILVAQGRQGDAAARAHRLMELYEFRSRQDGVLDVLRWMVRARIASSEEEERLLEMLRSGGRAEEAEAIALEMAEPAGHAAVGQAAVVTSATAVDDDFLGIAEARFAAGDVEGAAASIRSALRDEASLDAVDRGALLRLLQVTGSITEEERETLLVFLRGSRLPEDLAHR